ncbi:histidine kinase dimerization/phospho-acceptor domain-containing protein, partial [Asticcacaulis biprosthecium]
MPFKAYFQEVLSPSSGTDGGLRLGVILWHLGWASVMLLGLLRLLFMSASPLVSGALVAMTVPGACAVMLLSRDSPAWRQGLIWIWAACATIAVLLTGGIAGPAAAWVLSPIACAVVLNQRRLISLAATLSVVAALIAIMAGLWQGVRLPDPQEAFWLSLMSILSVAIGLGVGLLPALRARVDRAHDAEDARARLLRMLTEQPHLILCLDGHGKVVSAYGEAPPGLDLNSLMSLGLSASAHAPDRATVKAALDQASTTGRAEIGFTPHGALDHYVSLSLRRGADNRLHGVLSDASLIHAREVSLEASRAEAESLNQSKTKFLASMSHELRTPLNAVIGFSDIMRQKLFGDLSPKYTEYAQLIWESGQHVLDMINDVLDMSKIEAQKYELTLETFDLREPVSGALRLIRAAAHDKAIEITSTMPVSSLTVTADKRAIKQICLNLLSNAVKFTPKGGDVALVLGHSANEVEITIRDTGIGIAPDDLSRLGQPYEQAGPAEQKAMGTGLGL